MKDPNGPIDVLLVDDDPDFTGLCAAFLERLDERLAVTTATSVREGLDRLAETEFDCVVSDYDMPGPNGLEFLETVRVTRPGLPFLLLTGKGSEDVASDAISAGVTDYIKKGGANQYELLANRIGNAVEAYRAERRAARWARAVETANEGVAVVDDEGRFVEMNGAYAELHGVDPDDLLGEHWSVTVRDDEAERLRKEVLPELAAGNGWSGESYGVRADGSVYPKHLSLASIEDGGHVCVVRDISERRAREEELRRNDTKLDVLFGQSPDMISVHDAEGTLIDVNERLCDELGYSEAELLGTSVLETDPALTAEEARDAWDAMEPGEAMRIETEFRRSDGSTFPVEIHLSKVVLDGEAQFFVISRDVSERKERERKLSRQNERLEGFASVVSHDLRNPLNVATGRLQLAQEECDSEHLDAVARSHERMSALIDDLLTVARQGGAVTDVEAVPLDDVARSCWRTVETGAATLVVDTDAVVRADRGRLRQLFENLFSNAVRHGGAIEVTVGDLPDGFYVEDDGSGIPESERERVFEYGYSTAESGIGFGLNIVERIVDDHGWSVRVVDGTGGGARFEVTDVETGEAAETE